MSISRRSFLRAGAIGAVASAMPFGLDAIVKGESLPIAGTNTPARSLAPGIQGDLLSRITRSSMREHLNSTFKIQVKDENWSWVQLRLVRVTGSPKPARGRWPAVSDEDSFSLLFRGARELPLPQENYKIQHSQLGEFRMLLVPTICSDRTALYYEAVINRARPRDNRA